ncbi:lipid-A-disaccharide synthase [Geoalkalibacter halelectricus]|uniref:Lipid-A-disaccharide synthase n=1 Tax=Geoalkalibacter halelectricus TaxID=2847045 RepID=A0ABY5ZJP2_9BACT|nr:lipid-A-disaccharide synthase [Geoalkalibacter halelectricus]MDO3379567.1 lipid-A-disaccharide synthase [Geoalkalibacter halelectricus]UWZ78155.1 lipid-A-disaccharide synthase [Geoalkalibacter halelectricus]
MANQEQPQGRRALIVTGEASGDLHGANLIQAAREIDPGLSFFGVGGRRMEQQGCEILFRGEELAVVGLVEVAAHFPAIYHAFKQLERILRSDRRPDVLILIDFPEFNLRLAAKAKAAGIPVLYYVSPQVWAWRRGRVRTIAQRVDRLAAIFPFEPQLYEGLDIDVEYVGHPLVADLKLTAERDVYLLRHGLDPQRPVVGLFPGSRRSELKYIFDTIADTARLLRQKRPQVQFLLPVASSLKLSNFHERLLGTGLEIKMVRDNIYDTARACDAVVSVSGTVTLQIALVETPLAILYQMNPLTYAVGKRLVKVPHIGLVNIVAGKSVVREFIQEDAKPEAIGAEVLRMLEERSYRDRIVADLREVRRLLGEGGCSEKVARMASEMSRGQTRRGATA